MTDVCDFF